ncbi:MAG: hypothetical protein AB7G48_08740 [Nitrospiraceae bacterium]
MKRVMFLLLLAMAVAPEAWAQTWPNEPAGSTVINDWGWNSCPGGGWQPAYGCGFIRSDATAPLSPSSILRYEYNTSSGYGGGDPFIGLNNDEIFVGLWMKLSNPFVGDASGSNKLFYFSVGGSGYGLWFKATGPQSTGPRYATVHLQGVDPAIDNCHISGWGECSNRTWQGGPNITLGVWHRVEYYYKRSSSKTSRDGISRVWLDGASVINVTNLNTPQSSLDVLYITTTWTPPVDRSNPDMISFDHIHVSAPSGGGGTPKGDTTPPVAPTGLRAN